MQTMQRKWSTCQISRGSQSPNVTLTVMTEETRGPLVGTGEAAEQCGVARTTLARWAAAGLVTPAARTAGGHLRWDVDQLRAQLDQLAKSRRQHRQ